MILALNVISSFNLWHEISADPVRVCHALCFIILHEVIKLIFRHRDFQELGFLLSWNSFSGPTASSTHFWTNFTSCSQLIAGPGNWCQINLSTTLLVTGAVLEWVDCVTRNNPIHPGWLSRPPLPRSVTSVTSHSSRTKQSLTASSGVSGESVSQHSSCHHVIMSPWSPRQPESYDLRQQEMFSIPYLRESARVGSSGVYWFLCDGRGWQAPGSALLMMMKRAGRLSPEEVIRASLSRPDSRSHRRVATHTHSARKVYEPPPNASRRGDPRWSFDPVQSSGTCTHWARGFNEVLETDNLCWNVFCGECEKMLIPSHNCCCVVKKKLAWLKLSSLS